MAKINTSTIDGYENMTAEEKVAALEALEYEDNSGELVKLKKLNEKANSEAAEWKRKHNALLNDDERKQQEANERYQAMEQELKTLKRDKTVASYTANYLKMGYDEALANETALAMADGDNDKVFECQKKFLEAHDKEVTKGAMKNMSRPGAGGAGNLADEYKKKADEALKNGNPSEAAYYTRLAQSTVTES